MAMRRRLRHSDLFFLAALCAVLATGPRAGGQPGDAPPADAGPLVRVGEAAGVTTKLWEIEDIVGLID